MAKNKTEKIDWFQEAEYYKEELFRCEENFQAARELLNIQSDKINRLEETIFILTDIIRELKKPKN